MQRVVALQSKDLVVSGASGEQIVPRATLDDARDMDIADVVGSVDPVAARAPEDQDAADDAVVPRAALVDVTGGRPATVDEVVAGAAEGDVIAVGGVQGVVAVAAVDLVLALAGDDLVVPASAADEVPAGAGADEVAAA